MKLQLTKPCNEVYFILSNLFYDAGDMVFVVYVCLCESQSPSYILCATYNHERHMSVSDFQTPADRYIRFHRVTKL